MPTLATGISVSKPRPRQVSGGFTLIEIMIVVFIIGLMSAAAVITFGGQSRDTQLDEEAQRLNALLDYVREQAELQTRDFGVRVIRSSYQFVVFDPVTNQWRLEENDDALRERRIPDGLVPTLVLEGRRAVLDSRWPKIEDFKPQIMIFANGDLSSFEWRFTRPESGAVALVMTDEQSVLRMALPGDAAPLTDAERLAPPATSAGTP